MITIISLRFAPMFFLDDAVVFGLVSGYHLKAISSKHECDNGLYFHFPPFLLLLREWHGTGITSELGLRLEGCPVWYW